MENLVLTVVLVTLFVAGIGLAAGTAALLVQSPRRSLILSLAGHFCFCAALVILTTVIGQQLKKPAMALDLELPDKLILILNLSGWISKYLYVLILALVVDVGVSMALFRGTSVSRLARGVTLPLPRAAWLSSWRWQRQPRQQV